MLETGAFWGFTGSTMTSLMFFWAMYKQFFPYHLRAKMEKWVCNLMGWASNSVHIKFNEYAGEACAKRLKANETQNSKSLVISLDDQEVVEDVFDGVKVKWSSSVTKSKNKNGSSNERRYLTLRFHNRDRETITKTYLDHVLRQGKEIGLKNRERKLYTNNSSCYLLFGPPGTGKSTMISAMANFLEYDVYDLELTTVTNNSDLKRLLLDTKGRSIRI
ncbi:hypothetical protein EUTSA_v100053380mg, partial [Eutrema salsugineum]